MANDDVTPTAQDRETARRLSPCTCWPPSIRPPSDGRGPLADHGHYANCPAENVEDIATALAHAHRKGWEAGTQNAITLIDGRWHWGQAWIRNALRALRERGPKEG